MLHEPVRPITKFEFATMWGGVDFDPTLQAALDSMLSGEPKPETFRWDAIDVLTHGPLYQVVAEDVE